MTRTAFTDGQILMAAQLQNVHDSGGVVVASTTEMNLLPTTVKTCWYAGYTYRRNSAGTWVQDGAEKVPGYPMATVITNWNTAVTTGFYRSTTGAAYEPSNALGDTHWMGFAIAYNADYVKQVAWPLGTGNYPPDVMLGRSLRGGTWTGWHRNNAYNYSWSGLDNLTFLQHVQSGYAPEGVRRFAHGMAKADSAPASANSLDEWRVQCYDLSGNFTWSAIKIPENGNVSMPRQTRAVTRALTSQEPIEASETLTVGGLVKILDEVLTPTQKKKLAAKLRVIDTIIDSAIEELEDDD